MQKSWDDVERDVRHERQQPIYFGESIYMTGSERIRHTDTTCQGQSVSPGGYHSVNRTAPSVHSSLNNHQTSGRHMYPHRATECQAIADWHSSKLAARCEKFGYAFVNRTHMYVADKFGINIISSGGKQ